MPPRPSHRLTLPLRPLCKASGEAPCTLPARGLDDDRTLRRAQRAQRARAMNLSTLDMSWSPAGSGTAQILQPPALPPRPSGCRPGEVPACRAASCLSCWSTESPWVCSLAACMRTLTLRCLESLPVWSLPFGVAPFGGPGRKYSRTRRFILFRESHTETAGGLRHQNPAAQRQFTFYLSPTLKDDGVPRRRGELPDLATAIPAVGASHWRRRPPATPSLPHSALNQLFQKL
jgi:hypothetical protein